jgi:hypothetical protein
MQSELLTTMTSKASKSALIAVLSALVAVALVDPGDQILHLKLPLFILTLAIWVLRLAFGRVRLGAFGVLPVILFYTFILPGVASIIGLLGQSLPGGEPSFAIFKGFTVILLIPVVASENIDLPCHVIRWSLAVAVLTISIAMLQFVSPIAFSAVYLFTREKGNAAIGPRDLLGLGIGSFYYMTVAVLVFPIAYHLRNIAFRPRKISSYFFATVFLGAVLCSGSRAAVLGAFLIAAVIGFEKLKKSLGLGVGLSILLITVSLASIYFIGFFHSDEPSNAAKLGHVQSYIEEFEAHPTYLLWGQGADTEFYTEGFGKKVVQTELSYIELVRQFGIPATFVILAALLYPIFALMRQSSSISYLLVPYVVYLWEASTNPLLIGSTGLMVVSAIWGVLLAKNAGHAISLPPEVSN